MTTKRHVVRAALPAVVASAVALGLPAGAVAMPASSGARTVVASVPAAAAAPARARRARPRPGTYTGSQSQSGNPLVFWIAPGSRRMVNIAISGLGLGCVGGGGISDVFGIAGVTIRRNGTFRGSATRPGLSPIGVPMTFSYSFSGHFAGSTASGSLRENARSSDGAGTTCTSNALTWKATLDQQPRQTNLVVSGSYKGSMTQSGNPLSFDVSPSRTLQGITVPGLGMVCVGGGGVPDQFHIASAPVGRDGAIAGSGTSSGVVAGQPVTFTYSFTGRFEGRNAARVPRAAGMLREDATFASGRRCTSNTVLWSATLGP
jgi:hypothetical protein